MPSCRSQAPGASPALTVEGGQGHRRLGAEVIVLIVRAGTGVRVLRDPGLDEQHRRWGENRGLGHRTQHQGGQNAEGERLRAQRQGRGQNRGDPVCFTMQ